jgi:hypothetical protein
MLLGPVAPWLRVEFEFLISAAIVGASTFILPSSANMVLRGANVWHADSDRQIEHDASPGKGTVRPLSIGIHQTA